jgi:lysozyme
VRIYEGIEPCFGDARMTTNELGAYLSLAFNVGPRAVCASSIPRKVRAGQHAQACETITEFNKSGGKVLPGLVRRRRAEAELCLSGL